MGPLSLVLYEYVRTPRSMKEVVMQTTHSHQFCHSNFQVNEKNPLWLGVDMFNLLLDFTSQN